MELKIISGGQTGVDWGALEGARANGWETGGWAPKGWFNELGRQEFKMREFGLRECPTIGYPARSMRNVDDADATITLIWDNTSVGTWKTLGYAETHKWKWGIVPVPFPFEYKPCLILRKELDSMGVIINSIKYWIREWNVATLNVAGHRESSHPGIQEFTKQLIIALK